MGVKKLAKVGEKIGRLVILKDLGVRLEVRYVLAKCDCGNEKEIRYRNILEKKIISCGCYNKEKSTKHGLYNTPEYWSLKHAKDRCLNPNDKNFKNYGGRGIKIHPDFLGENGVINFFNHIGKRPSPNHSLDRINNNGNYEPGNIKWSNSSEQNLNQRKKENTSSRFRGVCFNRGKWESKIRINGKRFHLGLFLKEEDAAEAYLEKYYETYKKWPPEYRFI